MIGEHVVIVTPLDGDPMDVSCLVDQVAIRHGREDTTGQPEASAATIDMDLSDAILPTAVEIGSTVEVVTKLTPTVEVARFVGRVTDVNVAWDDAGEDTPNAGVAQVIATGPLADLGRAVVGDVPMPKELDGARAERVLALAGVVLDPLTSDPGTVNILPRDIDSTDALGVVHDAATSAQGVLWQTTAGEVRYADADHRRNIPSDLTLDVCQILVTPQWTRNLQGLINKASIGYGASAEGEGEQPRVLMENAVSIARYGVYDYSLTTALADEADAQEMASLVVARNATPVWVMAALPVNVKDLSEADTEALLSMDMHSLLTLTGLPLVAVGAPTTATLWVEGWSETLAWGLHELELSVSGYCRTAPAPRWDDVDETWTWDAMGSMSWDEATCLGPPVPGDTWSDVPASTRWDTVPATVTWDGWTGGIPANTDREVA